ncbi:MAG: CDP-alcohol phosphatidyltransferase family protein [Gammaproteobacteria bacterium]|nr:CDP-alcohol phosphatidyltransferase family protein [Gammaproteobacteria bacterium]
MQASNIPNAISLGRILLVPPMVVLLLNEYYGAALVLFAVAGVSDALDGYLAKRYGWGSRLGSILDPLADKLLLVSAYLVLGWLGEIPLWLVMAVVGRDLVIVAGGVAYHYLIGSYELEPSLLSKLNTLAQIVLILAMLVTHSVLILPAWLVAALVYLVLVTTLLSGLSYVWTWGVRALRAKRRPQ